MDRVKNSAFTVWNYFITFLKWVIFGVIIGIVVGTIGTLFHITLDFVTEVRGEHSWTIYLLPLAGLVIVFLYRKWGKKKRLDTNLILTSVRTGESLPLKMAPLIFVSTLLTHLFGGSAGREGAALQLGGTISQQFGRLFRFHGKKLNIATLCGMSACFSALFGTPITATVFCMEVTSVGVMHYSALVPCAISSITGFYVTRFFGISPWLLPKIEVPKEVSAVFSLKILLLAAACAIVSILFCIILRQTGKIFNRYFKNQYLRVAVGGSAIILLYLLIGNTDYLGAGTSVIESALLGKAFPLAFLIKIIFTAITLKAGFKGGEIVPTLFIGATFGCVFAGVIGLPSGFCAAIGMICLFCGVTNCPLTSLFLSIELFGADGLLWYLLAVAVSYMLSGYFGLYSKQKILYSKEFAEFIDTSAV